MGAHTKSFPIDSTAFVAVEAESYCNHIVVYEDVRAATTNIYHKGASAASDQLQKVAGEKIEFHGRYKPGDTAGFVKAVSIGAITMAQEEDPEV